jgi:YggT family protein
MKLLGSIINLVIGLIEIVLGLRFLFKLIGATSTSGLIAWIYDVSAPFVEPFQGILPNISFGSRFVLELSTLIALLVFGLVAAVINQVFD